MDKCGRGECNTPSACRAPEYSQGVMVDGAVLLKNGIRMTVDEVVAELSAHAREVEALRLRAEAAEADARRWRHVRDEMTYHYGDGQTEPRECVIHLEWFQGPWVRDGSNGGSGRPDSFPGWDTIVDEAITKLADELQELDDDAAIASGGEDRK